jgi:hypothetical protein
MTRVSTVFSDLFPKLRAARTQLAGNSLQSPETVADPRIIEIHLQDTLGHGGTVRRAPSGSAYV